MSISNQNSNKFQKYIERRFWLWEYQRRNSDYRKSYDSFIKKLSKNNLNYADLNALSESKSSKFTKKDWAAFQLMVEEKKKFILKYEMDPKDYKDGIDSEKLLDLIDYGVFEYPPPNIEKILLKTKIINSDWPYLTVQMDLKEDLVLLIKEITALYDHHHLINNPGNLTSYDSLLEKVQSHKNDILLSQLDLKQGKKRIYPKAVGLWLWDRYSSKDKIRGAKKEIYTKYREIYEKNPDRCRNYSDAYMEDKHLDRILKCTNKCIEMMKVLPMTIK